MDELTINFISLIVAIIGCATGLISIIIVLINNIFQIGKQRFSLSEKRKSYYFKSDETNIKGCYNTKICATVSIKATNQSSYPITIDEVVIQNKNLKAYHYNDFSFDYIEVPTAPNIVTSCDTEKLATLPLKLDPFETKYFAVGFPFFENLVLTYGEEIKAKLIVTTPRKKYKMNIFVPEYYSFFPNRLNKSISNDVASRSANK